MNRFLSISLAIYVFSLTLVPCVDKEMNSQAERQIQTTSTGTDSHQAHNDSCSPFCHCSCCNISMEVASLFNLEAVYSSPQILSFFISPKIQSDYIYSVWEPPKA